jgi:hypothetical protein
MRSFWCAKAGVPPISLHPYNFSKLNQIFYREDGSAEISSKTSVTMYKAAQGPHLRRQLHTVRTTDIINIARNKKYLAT